MRIFYAVPRAAWVEVNLRQSLEAMGHELIPFTFPGWPDDADPEWNRQGKPRTNQRLLERFRAALRERPVDLVFGYFYSSVAYADTIAEIRRSGVPTVNFSCNNVHQFELVEPIAREFDLCIVPEAAAIEKFRAAGARPVRIQLAANPQAYHPCPEPRVYDVTFVGQRYADRADYLLYLHRNGVNVRAWGAGWQPAKRANLDTLRAAVALVEDERLDGVRRIVRAKLTTRAAPAVAAAPADTVDTSAFGGPRRLQRDLVRTFSQSHISLGFATAGDSHRGPQRLTHLRLREFEAPMSGALYLTEQQQELAEYFDIGREVLCYENQDDMLDQARYYLAHPEQAEQIRRAGRHRSLREHTWQHRFQQLFDALGLCN